MPTLRDYLLTKLAEYGFTTENVVSIQVPVDDPRVPGGTLVLSPAEFAGPANQVDVADARRDLLIDLREDFDIEAPEVIPRSFTVAWVDGDFRIVRGDGASPYPFNASDLLA